MDLPNEIFYFSALCPAQFTIVTYRDMIHGLSVAMEINSWLSLCGMATETLRI